MKSSLFLDHQVFGTIVVPGAMHLVRALGATQKVLSEGFILEDVEFGTLRVFAAHVKQNKNILNI